MSIDRTPTDKEISEFYRIPESLFYCASRSALKHDVLGENFLVSVKGDDNKPVDVLVTSVGEKAEEIERIENLDRYKKNPEAKRNAIERVFKQAANGNPVKVQIKGWRGNSIAFVIRADMNG